MRSFLYAIAVGLVGAALLHIVIILSLPSFTGRDAYTRVQAFGWRADGFPDFGTPVADGPYSI